jgi:hypothetical protein
MAAPPKDPKLTRIRVSSTLAGTYTALSMARTFERTAGTEGGSTLRWFGGEAESAGDPTDTGSVTVWWDPDDTTGQALMRSSRDNQTTVFIQYAPQGTATGAKVRQMEILVTQYVEGADIDADAIEESYEFRIVQGTISTITLA